MNKTDADKNHQLEQLSRLTGQLAHEIKNPLSIIKINLKLVSEELEEAGPSETGQKTGRHVARALRKIAVISKETDRLEQILDSFLRYLDKTELQLSRVDINELVSDMIDFYSPQAYSRSVIIRQAFYSEPLICTADADMLKQVILNLFINAQQAMPCGGELMIKTDKFEKKAIIRISDTGIGIAPDKVSRVFDAFYSSKAEGTGLGLPTARKIIEAHGGAIKVDSEPGKGTCFTISLPCPEIEESA
jgi:two-component system, NtrC family, sensor histidine kinase HydH